IEPAKDVTREREPDDLLVRYVTDARDLPCARADLPTDALRQLLIPPARSDQHHTFTKIGMIP
ncbi:MAG: hypothetical protein LC749_08325, partial [Actinobacteria bacterium]|nr:hypothetical protein [Actinomycetota bacterium]